MDLFYDLTRDKVKNEHGVWVEHHKGVFLKIASRDNEKFLRLIKEKTQVALMKLPESNSVPEDLHAQIMRECMADAILLDWKGLTYFDEPFSYSRENALKALEIEDFFIVVSNHASRLSHFLHKRGEEDLSALKKTLLGGSSGEKPLTAPPLKKNNDAVIASPS